MSYLLKELEKRNKQHPFLVKSANVEDPGTFYDVEAVGCVYARVGITKRVLGPVQLHTLLSNFGTYEEIQGERSRFRQTETTVITGTTDSSS